MHTLQGGSFERPGHPEARASRAMVATSHPMATYIALATLEDGGNAVDAALAAVAMLSVVEPTQTGIGGDCFAILMRPGEAPIALNGSGWSPAALTLETAEAAPSLHETGSPHAVTIPGALAAWHRLAEDHGTRPLAAALEPAAKAASEGFAVVDRLASDWAMQEGKLRRTRSAMDLLLPKARPPRAGERFSNPVLSETLSRIARHGIDDFYRGRTAENLVRFLNSLGGVHALDDFSDFAPQYVEPISIRYRGYTLWECPPNGQGVTALMLARALDGFDLSAIAPFGAERFHLQAEMARLAYAERDLVVADPRFAATRLDWLLSEEHAQDWRRRFDADSRLERLNPAPVPLHRDTVHIAAVDRDGMAVSLINSIFDDFGSGLIDPATGIILHNRGSGFSLERTNPNVLGPRKRPLNTIIPAMLSRDGQPVMPFGVTGGHFQPTGQMHLLSNIIDYGLSIQQAIDAPRMFARGDTFELERRVPEAVAEELRRLGHRPTRAARPLGTAQAIWIDHARGELRGGADGRRNGVAKGF